MQKISILLISILFAAGCKETGPTGKNEVLTATDSIGISKADPLAGRNTGWVDSLVADYINRTENELMQAARKDTIPVEWFRDRTEDTDSAKYFVIQIGHSFENRFITDGWLYIDSLTRNIYEYDVPDDKLIKWPK